MLLLPLPQSLLLTIGELGGWSWEHIPWWHPVNTTVCVCLLCCCPALGTAWEDLTFSSWQLQGGLLDRDLWVVFCKECISIASPCEALSQLHTLGTDFRRIWKNHILSKLRSPHGFRVGVGISALPTGQDGHLARICQQSDNHLTTWSSS